jgi:UDP-N-acetylmuramoyl-tripeptide--D-alanyl-D-alanine ligase
VIRLSLREIAAAASARPYRPDGAVADQVLDSVAVERVTIDSRQAAAGSLFVALAGEHVDGHRFVADAAAAGAVAALVTEPQAVAIPQLVVADAAAAMLALGAAVRRRSDARAVAITGSVGKTTVKDLTAAALRSRLRTVAARGSFNNELGVPLTLLALEPDTQALVAEIGARHVGDIAHLAPAVAPDVAMVTAVAGVHLEIFGTIDAVAAAKAELVEALGPAGTAVLNAADVRVAAMAERAPASLMVAIDDARADVTAERVELDRFARPRAVARTPWGDVAFTVPISGRHHIGNGLFALAAAGLLGVDLDAAAAALADAAVSPWRGEITEVAGLVVLNDAYNASPTSVAAALRTLVAVERTGRTVAVLGVMAEIGEHARQEHVAIGRLAVELGVDRIVAVGSEAAGIVEGATDAGATADQVLAADDVVAARELVTPVLDDGDVVLVKGSRVAGLDALASALVSERAARLGPAAANDRGRAVTGEAHT